MRDKRSHSKAALPVKNIASKKTSLPVVAVMLRFPVILISYQTSLPYPGRRIMLSKRLVEIGFRLRT